MNRRTFIKRGTLFVPTIFIPRLIRAQTILTADGLTALKNKTTSGGGGGGGGNTAFITSISGGTTQAGFTFDGGFQFTVPSASSITITDLGRFALSGNHNVHTIYIRNSSCTNLASQTVDMTGVTVGTAAYSSITPLVLTTGTYWCMSSELSGGDTYLNDNCSVTNAAGATLTFSGYKDTSCHVSTSGLHAFGVATFKFHL